MLIKGTVLLFSITSVAAYVWYASQKNQAQPAPTPNAAPGMEKAAEPLAVVVTDEEIASVRKNMLSTSKSGVIMSDDSIRKMLEAQKQAPRPTDLVPSSKNPVRMIPPSDLKNLMEKPKVAEQKPHEDKPNPATIAPRDIAPSSKNIDAILYPSDLKKLIGKPEEEKPADILPPP